MPGNDIEIVRLHVKDAALLSAVATHAYSDHYLHYWHDGGQWYLQTYFSVSRFTEELRDPDALFFVPYYKKEPVGFLKLNLNKPLPDEATHALELQRIYLTAGASGKGIGTRLLQLTFEIAKMHYKEIVWLKVMDSSSGPIRFYEKAGFVICGTYQLSFVQMKEELRGMYIMQKKMQVKQTL